MTPSLTAKDADASLKFYSVAFGAVEHFRLPDEKTGGVAHAEFRIGNSTMMISDAGICGSRFTIFSDGLQPGRRRRKY